MPVAPPRPKGPPLNALRAFEAAARLGGFARAAAELCVTPGAVTQHVKALEAWAGASLFERQSQGVALTQLGESVLEDFTDAFDRMGLAVMKLKAAAAPHRIHIAALPSVAQLWLAPRLPGLRAALPGVSVSVTATETPPNLTREPFDLSLFIRRSGGVEIEPDRLFPVCAPALARRLNAPADLAGVPCLSDTVWADDWPRWLAHACPEAKIAPRGPSFSLYAMALAEAVAGGGVLIGHAPLVRAELESGALVVPFGPELATGSALRLEALKPPSGARALRRRLHTLLGAPG